jgi:hypothetical protein
MDNVTKDLLVTAPVEERPIREPNSVSAVITTPPVTAVVSNGQDLGSDGNPEGGGAMTARVGLSGRVHAAG